jgi:hypothetical protein
MIGFLLAVAAASQPLPEGTEMLTFSATPTYRPAVRVRVGAIGGRSTEGGEHYWFERVHSAAPQRQWTDSRTCQGASAVLAARGDILLPSLVPLASGEFVVVADGTHYRLESAIFGPSGRVGSISLTGNNNTELSSWVEQMLATLDRCWSHDRPQIGD